MLIIRFESTNGNKEEKLYNKIIIFNSNEEKIDVKEFEPQHIDLDNYQGVLAKYGINYNNAKIVFNDIIDNSYSFPFKLYLDITDSCQLNCKHCLTQKLNLKNQLNKEQLFSIIDECDKHGAFFVKLGGGEPLLHPNIFEIIKKFYSIGMRVSLSTNGIIVNDKIAKFLKENKVKTSVSLEGPKEINDYIRGYNHYEKAINALKILKQNNCECLLRVTLTRQMLDEDRMLEMIKLAKELNVRLKISYCRPAGNAIDNDLLIKYEDKDKYYNIIKLINRTEYKDLILMDEGMQLYQDPELKKMLYNDRICGAANRSFHINTLGEISPCVFLGENYKETGSCYKYGDILKYWNETIGENFCKVRDITMPNVCVNCDRLCKYECLATRLYFNENSEINDPNCLRGIKKCLKQK